MKMALNAYMVCVKLFYSSLLLDIALLNGGNQTPVRDDFLNERRERLRFEALTRRAIVNDTVVEVSLYFIPFGNTVHRLAALYDSKTDVDGVAVENTGKGFCNNAGNYFQAYRLCLCGIA